MFIFLTFSFFVSYPVLGAAAEPSLQPCSEIADNFSSSFIFAKKYLTSQKDTSKIEGLIAATKRCQLNSNDYGISRSDLEDLHQKTLDIVVQRLEKKIEQASPYRRVDAELSDYAGYMRKKGIPQSQIQKIISEHRASGENASRENEKSCSPMDVSKDLGPVRNQDTVGWCYAFTAADLLSYKMKQRISATDIAMNYSDGWIKDLSKKYFSKNETDFSGGEIYTAIGKAQERGVCLEKNLPDTDNGLGELKYQMDRIESFQENPRRDCEADLRSLQNLFPKVSLQDYLKIIKTANRANFMKVLQNTSCHPRIKRQKPFEIHTEQALIREFSNTEKIFQNIDQQLSKNNVVGVAYDRNTVLFNQEDGASSPHASVIVGRQFNKGSGQCLYLIRNSDGPSCAPYPKEFKCVKGNIWIPKEVLARKVTSVTYIE